MGLLAVKIAQYYALRADFIDESTCVYLAKLYEYSYEAQKQDIDEIIGDDMWTLTAMKSYEKLPFASVSIGQVHLGFLRNSGNKSEKVAIKIRRENFKKELKYSDLLRVFKYHTFYMFKLGVFHGDLHPGNIILGENGDISLIDCSTIGRVKTKLRVGLFWFFYYLSRYDYEKSAFYLNEMSEKN